ncbi:MAG: hypothetical protein COB35_06075 [Gammaproteobacteria bacterium]|nr:MAG: hypothetical protein COB35_06075 [Gammaproteobacteria bacterium]
MTSMPINSVKKSTSRRTLILVFAVFTLPVILAKFALNDHWFNYGVTNQGTLVANEITLEKMGLNKAQFNKKWLMLYVLPETCAEQCQQILHNINNTYVALGKEAERVTPLVLTNSTLTAAQQAQLHSKKWQIQDLPTKTQQLFTQPQVLIVDPLGNVILSHQPPKNSQALPLFGKALLADFKKVLKYSRIG